MLKKINGSFRDYKNQVYDFKNIIIRRVIEEKKKDSLNVLNSEFYFENKNNIIETSRADESITQLFPTYKNDLFLLHKKLEFISYPVEWPFFLYKKSSIFHLDLHIEALKHNYNIIDSSPYNIQFTKGLKPVFIDFGSIVSYEENQPWFGYKQFCEQFLGPLLIEGYSKINFQEILNYNLEGIDISTTSRILPIKSYFNLKILLNIHLHSLFINKIDSKSKNKSKKKLLKKNNFIHLLESIKSLITNLNPNINSYWKNYETKDSYDVISEDEKKITLINFIRQNKIQKLIDLGCNEGIFSEIALNNGCEYVLGIDSDYASLQKSCVRAETKSLNFLPLFIDLTEPTPNLGFNNLERDSFLSRSKIFDGLIAFALIHHLFLSKNIPLEKIVDLFLSLSPKGIIEFVPSDDPQFKELIKNKSIKNHDYSEISFEFFLKKKTQNIKKIKLKNSLRTLYIYEK